MLSIDDLKTVWLLISLSLIPVTIAYFIYFKKMINILIVKHSEVYKELGEVDFVKNNTVSSSGKFVAFLILGKYKYLKDSELNNVGRISGILLVLGFIIFAVAFIMPIIIGKFN